MMLGTCQSLTCARTGVRLVRGLCHCCHQRWLRAGKPAAGVPAPRCLPRDDPRHPTHCACGRPLGAADGRVCGACRQRKARSIARPCVDCGGPTRRGARCRRCEGWPARHGGMPYPQQAVTPRRRPAGVPGDWIPLVGIGWIPNAGYCAPGESYGQVAGCAACGYRTECAELSAQAVAS